MVGSTEGDDDHRDLESLERDSPEREEEAGPVEAACDVLLDLLLADAGGPAVSGDAPDAFAYPLQSAERGRAVAARHHADGAHGWFTAWIARRVARSRARAADGES
jgi:hypothetical protein